MGGVGMGEKGYKSVCGNRKHFPLILVCIDKVQLIHGIILPG
jgi:hypothetical protein